MKYWIIILVNALMSIWLLLRDGPGGAIPEIGRAAVSIETAPPMENSAAKGTVGETQGPAWLSRPRSGPEVGMMATTRRDVYTDDWVVSSEGDLLEAAAKDLGVPSAIASKVNTFLADQRAVLMTRVAQVRSEPTLGPNTTKYIFPPITQEWQTMVQGVEALLLAEGLDQPTAWRTAALIGDSRSYRPYSCQQALLFHAYSTDERSGLSLSWEVGEPGDRLSTIPIRQKDFSKDEIYLRFQHAVDFAKILDMNK